MKAILRDAPIHLPFVYMFQDQIYFAVDTAYWMDDSSDNSWMYHIYASLSAIDEDDVEMTTY